MVLEPEVTAIRINVAKSGLILARRRVTRRHIAAFFTKVLEPCILKTNQIYITNISNRCQNLKQDDLSVISVLEDGSTCSFIFLYFLIHWVTMTWFIHYFAQDFERINITKMYLAYCVHKIHHFGTEGAFSSPSPFVLLIYYCVFIITCI